MENKDQDKNADYINLLRKCIAITNSLCTDTRIELEDQDPLLELYRFDIEWLKKRLAGFTHRASWTESMVIDTEIQANQVMNEEATQKHNDNINWENVLWRIEALNRIPGRVSLEAFDSVVIESELAPNDCIPDAIVALMKNAIDAQCSHIRVDMMVDKTVNVHVRDNGIPMEEDIFRTLGESAIDVESVHGENMFRYPKRGTSILKIVNHTETVSITLNDGSGTSLSKAIRGGQKRPHEIHTIAMQSATEDGTTWIYLENVAHPVENVQLVKQQIYSAVVDLALINPDISISLRDGLENITIFKIDRSDIVLDRFVSFLRFKNMKHRVVSAYEFLEGMETELMWYVHGTNDQCPVNFQFIYINGNRRRLTTWHSIFNRLFKTHSPYADREPVYLLHIAVNTDDVAAQQHFIKSAIGRVFNEVFGLLKHD